MKRIRYETEYPPKVGTHHWHMIDGYNQGAQAQLEADQEKVREMFEEIEKHFRERGYRDERELKWWQALKKKCLGGE